MYEYRAAVLRVVDGDTVHVRADLGCDIFVNLTFASLGSTPPRCRRTPASTRRTG